MEISGVAGSSPFYSMICKYKYLTSNMVLPDGVFSCLESFSELTVICVNHRCSYIQLLSLEIVIDISSERVKLNLQFLNHLCLITCVIMNVK